MLAASINILCGIGRQAQASFRKKRDTPHLFNYTGREEVLPKKNLDFSNLA
jgi:hypothetical protein